jgi:hypothetical protein
MFEHLGELSSGGIFAVLLVWMVLNFLGRKKDKVCVDPEKLAKQVQDLWVWHNKEDDEGVKIWYVRKSLEDAINKLAENIEQQTNIFRELINEIHKRKNL